MKSVLVISTQIKQVGRVPSVVEDILASLNKMVLYGNVSNVQTQFGGNT